MAKRKKQTNRNQSSKKSSWISFEKYIDRLFDWAYVTNVNRYDQVKKRKKIIPKHVITKENTKKGYSSQVKQYCKWVYSTKGETNLRYYKKAWFEEYLNEKFKNEDSDDLSISSVFTQISALTKFENILEEKWKVDRGEKIQFGIIADKRVRESLKENKIYRDIENMKKSRPIWEQDVFLAIENELVNDEYKKLWRFLGLTGMRLESALLLEKKDIYDDYFHIEHGKAGKRSDVHLLNPNLISGSVENVSSYLSSVKENIHNFKSDYSRYKEERRVFDNFKKDLYHNGSKMRVNKKLSTIKTDFEKAVREASLKLKIANITVHSARKYYTNSVYSYMNSSSEEQVDKYLIDNAEKYENTYRKELFRINSKRKIPRNFSNKTKREIPLNNFNDILKFFTHEEKAALISSVESSHNRISILSFYINRNVARKIQGNNIWYRD